MFTGILIGVLSGLVLGLLIAFLISPKLMFREKQHGTDFDATVAKLEQAIESKGWKTPAVHDLQATMQKFGHDVRKVKILEICNPDLAFQVLDQSRIRIQVCRLFCSEFSFIRNT